MGRKGNQRPSTPGAARAAVTGTLRVIGGSLRGRPIAYSGDAATRPMKQRVREAAFNLLGTRVAGTHVIDLFAGTGALAWEALSRGARRATLVERHFPTARLIRANAEALGLIERATVVPADTFIWAQRLAGEAPDQRGAEPWLVFCSPPYDLYVTRWEAMLGLLDQLVALAPRSSLLVVESDQRFDAARLPRSCVWDVRAYPPAVLAVGEIRAEEPSPS